MTDVLDFARALPDEWTICTARAPDAVFAVRTYGDTAPPYEPPIGLSGGSVETRVARHRSDTTAAAGSTPADGPMPL